MGPGGKAQQPGRGGVCPALQNGQNCHTASNCHKNVCNNKTGKVKQSELDRDQADKKRCKDQGGCHTSLLETEEAEWIFAESSLRGNGGGGAHSTFRASVASRRRTASSFAAGTTKSG